MARDNDICAGAMVADDVVVARHKRVPASFGPAFVPVPTSQQTRGIVSSCVPVRCRSQIWRGSARHRFSMEIDQSIS